MPNLILASFALAIVLLFVWSLQWGDKHSPRLWLLWALMAGMLFDNSMQAIGNWTIDSDWYQPLSRLRWAAHVLVLPFLSLFALSLMRLSGIQWAHNRLLKLALWLIVLGSLAYGIWHDILLLELSQTSPLGVTKYTSAVKSLPYPTILANLLVILMAIPIWRAARWPWLFAGAAFIFITNAVTAGQAWGFIAANFAEVVFAVSLLASERYFSALAPSQYNK
ncbi:hypothetical protein GCM10007895_22630 [Paraferrimonas sedimenticola]|uniref:Uncharacterized protein n=2 Tax=Paraferrimonas sedimenticola TaxID=375674 RepID=A0AA37W1W5_9GAMM|nr:hypothetical protein [Paraferrimonas sedimenticola]GLP96957.1 hypothetical protein GCM10007895_22630 [Paraferrimonas sedimenticola]